MVRLITVSRLARLHDSIERDVGTPQRSDFHVYKTVYADYHELYLRNGSRSIERLQSSKFGAESMQPTDY
jgi:hypothetical protein